MNSAVDVTANAQIILLFEVIYPRPLYFVSTH